ncbi:MAG TPA: multidrug effflux MFS transporter [Aestuariivirgaceae bacterium]|nr:multidrug effflux MFS transporter [Aestuariivirgaceae bacterium]
MGSLTAAEKGEARPEFVVLVAFMISLVALSIDAMLPALPAIASELAARRDNDRQLVISALFLGLAAAQMVYGPLSDSFGRKNTIYAGIWLFIAGCCISIFAPTFDLMLLGRFLQGAGAAAPRVVSVAMVRDLYQGRAMARVMSLTMTVFILVPVFAPLLGQLVLEVAPWRAIFVLLLVLAVGVLLWFWRRQAETLPRERRAPFSLLRIGRAIVETCTNRVAFGYTLAAGFMFGAFVGYLNSSQQIFQDLYRQGDLFPVYFGALALSIGVSSALNARLVMRLGMRYLCNLALRVLVAASLVFALVTVLAAGIPPLAVVVAYLLVCFFCVGVLFGNFNALAMEPLGHIAGVASAVIGSLTTFVSLTLGTVIGAHFDGTLFPLAFGFAALGVASIATVYWTERRRPT